MNTLFEKFVKNTGLVDLNQEEFYDQTRIPVPNDHIEKNAYTHCLSDTLRLFVTSVTNKQDQNQNVTVIVYNTSIDCITHVYVINNEDQCDATAVLIKTMLIDPMYPQVGPITEPPSAVN